MEPFKSLTAVAAPIVRANVDTDIIIPSREMKSEACSGHDSPVCGERVTAVQALRGQFRPESSDCGLGELFHKIRYTLLSAYGIMARLAKPEDERSSPLERSLDAFQETIRKSGPAAMGSYTLIGAILLLGGIGYAIDVWRGTSHWFLLLGLVLGMIVGFYELAKAVWKP